MNTDQNIQVSGIIYLDEKIISPTDTKTTVKLSQTVYQGKLLQTNEIQYPKLIGMGWLLVLIIAVAYKLKKLYNETESLI